MIKYAFYFLCFISLNAFTQEALTPVLIKTTDLNVGKIVSIDNFGTLFYLKNNTLFKDNGKTIYPYNNLQLGEVTSADAFNPLKVNLFYGDMNTVVILDNRLAEIFKIDFNAIETYRNVSHVSTGNDNTLWIFNQDTNQLEVYDYLNNKTRVKTLPVTDKILDIESDYNFCWLLTDKFLYLYNYFGSLIKKIENTGFEKMAVINENIILKKKNNLYYLNEDSSEYLSIELPELLISQFLLNDESLYIYNGKNLYQYQLKLN